jgi:hypothetical protein
VALTEKDKEFLETLKRLMDSRDLSVELSSGRPSYMVLRGTYGDRIHQSFHVSRQGVRWRFWRLFNQIYVSAFETILFIETNFGSQLRDHALRISRERYALRRDLAFEPADQLARKRNRLHTGGDGP